MGVVRRVISVPDEYSAETLRVAAGGAYLGTSARAQAEWGYSPHPLEEGLPPTLRYEMRTLGMPTPD